MADSPSSDSGPCAQESTSKCEEGIESLRRPNRGAIIAARSSRHFNQQVDTLGADVLLYFCWFSTGLLDSTVFNVLTFKHYPAYRIFVLMQTGNLVFMGLDTSHNRVSIQPYGWVKSLSSFVAFLIGCVFFSHLGILVGSPAHPRRRLTLFLSFSIQAMFIFLAAILVETGVIESRIDISHDLFGWLDLVPIILLSIQGPGQILAGRQLALSEMPTVVASIMMYDFVSDTKLFARSNVRRTRRFVGVVAMFVGAVCGGWIVDKLGHITVALWVAGAVKACIAISWLLWPQSQSN